RSLNGTRVRLARVGERQRTGVEGQNIPRVAMLPKPGHAAIPHDGQQPGSRVPVAKALEVADRAEHGVLNDVLRVVLVAQEIACERVRIVQMRKDHSLESVDVALGHSSERNLPRPRFIPGNDETLLAAMVGGFCGRLAAGWRLQVSS